MTETRVDERVLGASYVSALLTEDEQALAMYRASYNSVQLLRAVGSQIVILGRRVAVESGRTMAELGADLVEAAELLTRAGL